MSVWLTQLINLIASDTGNILYHLVLAFTLLVAVFLTLNLDAAVDAARRRRSLLGLSLLLALQLGPMVVSALGWQGVVDGRLVLPTLDRLVSLLSLVIVVWLWCFPDPAPLGDAGSLLPALMVIVGTVVATLWWAEQPTTQNFNGVIWDSVAAVFALALAGLGMLYLALRRPAGFGFGLAMLLIVAAGFGLHLYLLPYGGDYPSALRLAQMAAYPLLAVLFQRLLPEAPAAIPAESSDLELVQVLDHAVPIQHGIGGDPALWQTLTRLAAESDPERVAREVAVALAESFGADVCALLVPPDTSGNFSVQIAYDRLHRRFIEGRRMEGRALPVLASAWRMGRSRRLASSASTPDLGAVAAAFSLEEISTLLFQPVLTADGKPGPSILLLALTPSKDWNPAEQEFLALLARLLVQFLQRTYEMTGLKEDIVQARQLARLAQDAQQAALEEKQKLQGQLAVLRENSERDHRQIGALTAIAAAHEVAQATLARLTEENHILQASAGRLEKTLGERENKLTGELRMALQELSLIQNALADADRKILSLKTDHVDAAPSQGQLELVSSIGKDLRQPLSSIGGYADVLLGETVGILGAKQRKYIERIKVSTERMARLLDELVQAAAPESNAGRLEFEPLDLRDVIQRAVMEAQPRLSLRRSALKLDLPSAPLQISSDSHALKKVIVQLLENAALASPEGGPVTVRLRVESSDSDQDYALIQVIDAGKGIAPTDILRVFSPQRLQASQAGAAAEPGLHGTGSLTAIPGLGAHPADLQQAKILIEAVGGRTWVDSDPGRGSTFSVLLPVNPPERAAAPGSVVSGNGSKGDA